MPLFVKIHDRQTPVIYRHLLLRYLVRPVLTLLVVIIVIALWLTYHPKLDTDMPSNLLVGVLATFVVSGFTLVHDMVTKSFPVLRRAWLFKGNRRLNVAYADAMPVAVIQNGQLAAGVVVNFIKPPSPTISQWPARFSISRPVPGSEVRAFKYIVKGFPEIDFDFVTDAEAMRSEIPVVAFGSECSNYCTNQIMMALGFPSIWAAGTGQIAYNVLATAALAATPGFEYGVIAVTNANRRLAIACWGLGETGTAGAAWFLANRNGELSKELEGDFDADFVALLKFPVGQDNNGQLVKVYGPNEMGAFASHL